MIRLVRKLAWWLIDTFPQAIEDRQEARRLLRDRKPCENEIDAALREGFRLCGMPMDAYALDCEPGDKRYEVLHHASRVLGNELKTVADLKALLQ